MVLVYDIGLYDGSDTAYYLDAGHDVVAIEANPNMVERAQARFAEQLAAGQLTLVHRALCDTPGQTLELVISGEDPGSSSVFAERVQRRHPIGKHSVQGTTLGEVFAEHGQPDFIKIDIEGADRHAILPLTAETRPRWLSFEIGDDFEELLDHLAAIGFTGFKLINQCNFLELAHQENLAFRIKRKLMSLMGYSQPRFVRLAGREFALERSSGPAPWESDGDWQDQASLLARWHAMLARGEMSGWYDLHAR